MRFRLWKTPKEKASEELSDILGEPVKVIGIKVRAYDERSQEQKARIAEAVVRNKTWEKYPLADGVHVKTDDDCAWAIAYAYQQVV